MSKANKALSTRIVDNLGSLEETDATGAKAWVYKLPEFGIHHAIVEYKVEDKDLGEIAVDVDKKTARERAIAYLTSELDAGNIVLSDTWADDNLPKSEKSHSEKA